jgi:hypothetical protein
MVESDQDHQLSPEQVAQEAAEMAQSKAAYDKQLEVIEAWRLVQAQLLPAGHPMETRRTVIGPGEAPPGEVP